MIGYRCSSPSHAQQGWHAPLTFPIGVPGWYDPMVGVTKSVSFICWQDCCNSIANTLKLPQSCMKPLMSHSYLAGIFTAYLQWNCQIWVWFQGSDWYFSKYSLWEINKLSFSSPTHDLIPGKVTLIFASPSVPHRKLATCLCVFVSSGAHFMNDFPKIIEIRWTFGFSVTPL